MASITNALAIDATLKNDIASQSGLIAQLIAALAAAAAGSVTPAQLQTLMTDLQGDDTTVQGATAAIQTALGTTPPPAAGGPPTSQSPAPTS